MDILEPLLGKELVGRHRQAVAYSSYALDQSSSGSQVGVLSEMFKRVSFLSCEGVNAAVTGAVNLDVVLISLAHLKFEDLARLGRGNECSFDLVA